MSPVRIVCFLLAFCALAFSGWATSRTFEMIEERDRAIERGEQTLADLQRLLPPGQVNVRPEDRDEFEMALFNSKLDSDSIAHFNAQVSTGWTYVGASAGAGVLLALFGLLAGRKKRSPSHAAASGAPALG